MRIMIWLLIVLVVGIPGVLWISAEISLDRDRAHTHSTAALPFLDEETTSGLVQVPVGDRVFRARVAGLDRSGPALILLHGFPETSIMWEPLIEAAARAGYRVVAFDQRGYSAGARPTEVDAYRVPELIDDLMGVADAVDFDQFHLVGHDWGAIVGWGAVAARHDRVASYVALSIPHPAAIPSPGDPGRVPAYVTVFRAPGVAETILGFGGRTVMTRLIYATMPTDQITEYDAVFSEPGALTAALNWYRALDVEGMPLDAVDPVRGPILYIYGTRDMAAFVGEPVQERLPQFVSGPLESIALDAGHWLIQEEEQRVVDAVMNHLNRLEGGNSRN